MSASGQDPRRLRVYVSPVLMDRWAPEVTWTLQTLLIGLGRPWEQVTGEAESCDLAYVSPGEPSPSPVLRLCADPARWRNASTVTGGAAVARLSSQNGHAPSGYDCLADCFALLSGAHERDLPANRHGHRTLPGSLRERQALCTEGPVSAAFERVGAALASAGLPPAPYPRWPAGKSWAAAASHDVDYPVPVRPIEALRILARRGKAGLPAAADVVRRRRHHWHFASWVELERRLGVRSAFYFVPRRGSLFQYALGTPDPFYDVTKPAFRRLFRWLESAGWEVGLQASYRAMEDRRSFGAEKQRLEQAAGVPVEGNRHHYWHMDPAHPDRTLRMHEEIGLAYDCSLTFDHYLGWRRGCTWPYWPFVSSERRAVGTLQLSTAWMDDQIFGHAALNGARANGDGDAQLDRLIATAAGSGGLLVTDIHEYVFDAELFPGWAATYERFWERVAARSDVWIATPAEVARHWADRARAIRSLGTGLTAAGAP